MYAMSVYELGAAVMKARANAPVAAVAATPVKKSAVITPVKKAVVVTPAKEVVKKVVKK
jgi:hypothetical protein